MVAGDSRRPGESPAVYNLEFRSVDDSWYSARAVLVGDALTVKYEGFTDANDETFLAGTLRSVHELRHFQRRFRPVSVQLQDSECSKVVPGTTVCASHSFVENDFRFHDALVEDVELREHAFTNGEEECGCIFLICWLHGPKKGSLTTTTIANICLVQSSADIDPMVASFSNIVMEKLQSASLGWSTSGGVLPSLEGAPSHERFPRSNIGYEFEFSEKRCGEQFSSTTKAPKERIQNFCKEMEMEEDRDMGGDAKWRRKCAEQFSCAAKISERTVKCWTIKEQERVLGGVRSQHFILLTNLEKDLSSRTVVEFLHNEIALKTEACIFPSLSTETFTRGIIVVDCKENLKKLYDFLESSSHIVVSSKGRPWVLGEKMSSYGLPVPTLNLTEKSQKKFLGTNVGIGSGLKIACMGTQEYMLATALRNLFKEFADHQPGLHQRLAYEEGKVNQMCLAA